MADLKAIRDHYESELTRSEYGAQRVGWRDESAQSSRFECIVRLFDGYEISSVSDLGCGRGDFLKYLRDRGWFGSYVGTDISHKMIAEAASRFKHDTKAEFMMSDVPRRADYLVASGIFNVSLDSETQMWRAYCEELIRRMWESAEQGIVFNMLSTDSNMERRKSSLSYSNPSEVLEFVRRELSTTVRLDQSYGQFDFTIAVFRSACPTPKIETA
jgi:SAM-dependent methyltransferase